jgi:hypothetical protein
MSDQLKSTRKTRDRLNQVGPGFCLAKWKQVTLHLHNGHTHSCHHPKTHRVPLEELAADPSALHNTSFKKELRRQMLTGGRPAECDYCWRVEDIGPESFSDRALKSAESWALPYLDGIKATPWDFNVDPSYVEVSFGSLCNMACAYCGPHVSSKWMSEIRALGPYPTTGGTHSLEGLRANGQMPIEGDNPYVEAFWKWWPRLYPSLRVLRVTGGEPLLGPDTFRLMDYILEHPAGDLDFSVNSNLMVPQDRIDQFLERAKAIQAARKVRQLSVFTSIDAWGRRGEYIRHGLRHEYFWGNVERVLRELPGVDLTFMCTFNALSVTSFQPLLAHVLELKRAYQGLKFDIAYLRNPRQLSVKILTSDYAPRLGAHLRFVEENQRTGRRAGFFDHEVNKMRRLYQWFLHPEPDDWIIGARRDFHLYFSEYDRRRGTRFLDVFPEMEDFWHHCAFLGSDHWLKKTPPPEAST